MLAIHDASCIELSVLVGVSDSNRYMLSPSAMSVLTVTVNPFIVLYKLFVVWFRAPRASLKAGWGVCRDLRLCRDVMTVYMHNVEPKGITFFSVRT